MAAKMFFTILALAVLTSFVMADEDDDLEGVKDDALTDRNGMPLYSICKYMPVFRHIEYLYGL